MHVTKLSIKNLRGVKDGVLDGLSPLSILVGPNNCGKSTCLEAIAVAGNWSDGSKTVSLLLRRGGPAFHALKLLMHGGEQGFDIDVALRSALENANLQISMRLDSTHYKTFLQEALRQGLHEPVQQVSLT